MNVIRLLQNPGVFVCLTFLICVITAILAARKGYEPLLWFFAGTVLGLLILAFLPFAKDDEEKQQQGNRIGVFLAIGTIIIAILKMFFPH